MVATDLERRLGGGDTDGLLVGALLGDEGALARLCGTRGNGEVRGAAGVGDGGRVGVGAALALASSLSKREHAVAAAADGQHADNGARDDATAARPNAPRLRRARWRSHFCRASWRSRCCFVTTGGPFLALCRSEPWQPILGGESGRSTAARRRPCAPARPRDPQQTGFAARRTRAGTLRSRRPPQHPIRRTPRKEDNAVFVAGFPTGVFAANCYIVAAASGAECVVVDPGQDAAPAVAEVVREHRLKPVAVLLTHGHLDHMWSVLPVCGTLRRASAGCIPPTGRCSPTRSPGCRRSGRGRSSGAARRSPSRTRACAS